MFSKGLKEKTYRKVLRLYPPAYRSKYGEEMAQVFRQQLAEDRSILFFLRSIGGILFSALSQQRHVILGVSALSFGLIVTYNQTLFAWDERSLQTGVITGITLLLTSIGLLRQKTWTIYPWAIAVLVIIDLVLQSTYWSLQAVIEPFCVATTKTIAVQGCGLTKVDIWFVLSTISVVIPAVATFAITKLILAERTKIIKS